MTTQEFEQAIERAKAQNHQHLLLTIPIPNGRVPMPGRRTRVIPGVMGRVVGPVDGEGRMLVDVELAEAERGLDLVKRIEAQTARQKS